MTAHRKRILICSQDPIFVKGLYGPLRDSGYEVETGEHPNDAVRSVIHAPYLAVILDSTDFGLNVADAAAIIRNVRPDIFIIVIGDGPDTHDLYTVKKADAVVHLEGLFKGLAKSFPDSMQYSGVLY